MSLSGRMGGPEAGRFHASLVQLRQHGKEALASLEVSGVETCEIAVWISGSLTDYASGAADTGTSSSPTHSSMKYFSRDSRLAVNIVVGRSTVEHIADGGEAAALAEWISAGFDDAHRPRSVQKLNLTPLAASLRSAVGGGAG